jgi:hypothetical protein
MRLVGGWPPTAVWARCWSYACSQASNAAVRPPLLAQDAGPPNGGFRPKS